MKHGTPNFLALAVVLSACVGSVEDPRQAAEGEQALPGQGPGEATDIDPQASALSIIPEPWAVRWRGGVPADLISTSFKFLALEDSSVGVSGGSVWWTPSLPLSLLVFQDPDRNPIPFPFPNMGIDVGILGSYDVSLDQIYFQTDWSGQRIFDVSADGSNLIIHAAFGARFWAQASTFALPNGYVYLDNVDVYVHLWNNPLSNRFEVRWVDSSVSYHLDFGWLADAIANAYIDWSYISIPGQIQQAITATAAQKLGEAHIQEGIVQAITTLQNNLADTAQIPMPRVGVYPGSIYLSSGNLCLRGYVCDEWGNCPGDDDRRGVCTAQESAVTDAYWEWQGEQCDGETGAALHFCARMAANAYSRYLRKRDAWYACLQPACDPWNPGTY